MTHSLCLPVIPIADNPFVEPLEKKEAPKEREIFLSDPSAFLKEAVPTVSAFECFIECVRTDFGPHCRFSENADFIKLESAITGEKGKQNILKIFSCTNTNKLVIKGSADSFTLEAIEKIFEKSAKYAETGYKFRFYQEAKEVRQEEKEWEELQKELGFRISMLSRRRK